MTTTTGSTVSSTVLPPALDVRLPLKVTPLHYDLELTPDIYTGDPDTFTFSGHVRIRVLCLESTNLITLHSNKLEIDGTVELLDQGPSQNVPMVDGIEKDEERQFLLIKLDGMLTVGQEYVIDISFHGPLNDDLVGLYWSSYQSGTETR